MAITIAIDCMGGDHGPHVTVPAALEFLKLHGEAGVLLVGQKDSIHAELLRAARKEDSRLQVRHAPEVVAMDEAPASALRGKRESSMRIAVNLVKSGEAQAAVSAGNTGALMAISRFVLKTLPGIDRPAIVSVLPTMIGSTYMLDLGANVDCSAEHLLQFAIMGSVLASAMEHKERPSVGLLNIGEESIKGNEAVKQAAELLRASGLNFIGNVEGDGIYKGHSDVVVCDGFVGNVALKTTEGLAQMLGAFLKQEFTRNILTRLAALVASPVLSSFKRRVDHRRYNGATLLGLRGIVVKSHGSADAFSFRRALERALEEASNDVIARMNQRLTPAVSEAGMIFSRIAGTGSYLPERVVSNDDLARTLDTSDDWICARTGIRQRHVAAPGQTTSDLAFRAAQAALQAAAVNASEIDLIILATSTPDFVFPSSACLLQARLGIKGCPAFDVQAVCSGFVYALTIADNFLRAGRHRCALVVGAEVFSRILDWNDRSTAVLFGDGAGAVVLKADSAPGILGSVLHADGSHAGILSVPGNLCGGKVQGSPFLQMDGQQVFKIAVRVLDEVARETLLQCKLETRDIDWLIPHQANLRILEATTKRLGLDPARLVVTVDRHANTSAASVPLALDVAVRDGRIRKGQKVMLQGVGGGFTWGAVLVEM